MRSAPARLGAVQQRHANRSRECARRTHERDRNGRQRASNGHLHAAQRRRQPDHRLRGDLQSGRRRRRGRWNAFHHPHDHRARQRHCLYVHGDGDQCDRHQPCLGAVRRVVPSSSQIPLSAAFVREAYRDPRGIDAGYMALPRWPATGELIFLFGHSHSRAGNNSVRALNPVTGAVRQLRPHTPWGADTRHRLGRALSQPQSDEHPVGSDGAAVSRQLGQRRLPDRRRRTVGAQR